MTTQSIAIVYLPLPRYFQCSYYGIGHYTLQVLLFPQDSQGEQVQKLERSQWCHFLLETKKRASRPWKHSALWGAVLAAVSLWLGAEGETYIHVCLCYRFHYLLSIFYVAVLSFCRSSCKQPTVGSWCVDPIFIPAILQQSSIVLENRQLSSLPWYIARWTN